MVGTAIAISLGVAALSSYMSARGQKKAGDAAKGAAESAAEQMEYNAGVSDLQAADALARGQDEETRFRASVRGMTGTQRAGFAGQNVEVGSGSAADVQADTAYLGELDARTIRSNAQREAWGYRVEGEDRRMAAAVARKGGQAAATAGKVAAANTVLGAGSSLLMQKYGWH